MQSKIIIFCILSIAVLQLHAKRNPPRDHAVCRRLIARCEAAASSLNPTDDTVNTINELCAQDRSRPWRNLTRCDLVKAGCRNKMNSRGRCATSTCAEMAENSRD